MLSRADENALFNQGVERVLLFILDLLLSLFALQGYEFVFLIWHIYTK